MKFLPPRVGPVFGEYHHQDIDFHWIHTFMVLNGLKLLVLSSAKLYGWYVVEADKLEWNCFIFTSLSSFWLCLWSAVEFHKTQILPHYHLSYLRFYAPWNRAMFLLTQTLGSPKFKQQRKNCQFFSACVFDQIAVEPRYIGVDRTNQGCGSRSWQLTISKNEENFNSGEQKPGK